MRSFFSNNTIPDEVKNDGLRIVPKSILKISGSATETVLEATKLALIIQNTDKFPKLIGDNFSQSKPNPFTCKPLLVTSQDRKKNKKTLRQIVRFSPPLSSGRTPKSRASSPTLVQLQIYNDKIPAIYVHHHTFIRKRKLSAGAFAVWFRGFQRRVQTHRHLKFGRKTNYKEQIQQNSGFFEMIN